MQRPILRIALPKTVGRLFDYFLPDGVDLLTIKKGMRIKVPFKTKERIGLIIDILESSEIAQEKLKTAIAIIDQETIIPEDLYKLCAWSADYYHFPVADSVFQAIPQALKKGLNIVS